MENQENGHGKVMDKYFVKSVGTQIHHVTLMPTRDKCTIYQMLCYAGVANPTDADPLYMYLCPAVHLNRLPLQTCY